MGEIFDPEGYDATISDIQPSDPAYIHRLKYPSNLLGRLREFKVALILEEAGLLQGSLIADSNGDIDYSGVDIIGELAEDQAADNDDTVNIQVKSGSIAVAKTRTELKTRHAIQTYPDVDAWIAQNRLIILDGKAEENEIIESFNRQKRQQRATPRNITVFDANGIKDGTELDSGETSIDEIVLYAKEFHSLVPPFKHMSWHVQNTIYASLPNGGLIRLSEEGFYTGWYRFYNKENIFSNWDKAPNATQATGNRLLAFYLPQSGEKLAQYLMSTIVSKAQADELEKAARLDLSALYRTVISLPAEEQVDFLRGTFERVNEGIVDGDLEYSLEQAMSVFVGLQLAGDLRNKAELSIKNYLEKSGTNIYEYEEDHYVIGSMNKKKQLFNYIFIPKDVLHHFVRNNVHDLTITELRQLYRQYVGGNEV